VILLLYAQVIVYTVAALSIERYIDARSTLTAKFRTLVTFGSLVLIWTLGLLVPYPFIFYTYLDDANNSTGANAHKNTTPMYSCQSHLTEKALLVHEIILYLIAFIIPYAIIVLFSLKLLKFLRAWMKRKEKLTRTSVSRKRTRGVKLVLCIVLSFLICYTPFWAFKFYTRFIVDENVVSRPILQRILSYVHLLVVILNHFEGVLNPLFFIVLTERFCLTFSKHRQRRSRMFGGASSAIILAGGRKSMKTAMSTSTTIGRNTETNGLLAPNNNHADNKDKICVNVQSL
jgi:MFS family permease